MGRQFNFIPLSCSIASESARKRNGEKGEICTLIVHSLTTLLEFLGFYCSLSLRCFRSARRMTCNFLIWLTNINENQITWVCCLFYWCALLLYDVSIVFFTRVCKRKHSLSIVFAAPIICDFQLDVCTGCFDVSTSLMIRIKFLIPSSASIYYKIITVYYSKW